MYALGTLKNHGFEWSTTVRGHPSYFHIARLTVRFPTSDMFESTARMSLHHARIQLIMNKRSQQASNFDLDFQGHPLS